MRFEINEMAKLVIARKRNSFAHLNETVEIHKLYVYEVFTGDQYPYGVTCADGTKLACADYQLQKLEPPKEPDAMTRDEEIEEELTA